MGVHQSGDRGFVPVTVILVYIFQRQPQRKAITSPSMTYLLLQHQEILVQTSRLRELNSKRYDQNINE